MSDHNFLKECTPEPQWAADREISQRTSARYRQQGLPYLEFGGRIFTFRRKAMSGSDHASGALIVSAAGTEPHEENWPARAGQHARAEEFCRSQHPTNTPYCELIGSVNKL